MKNHFKTLALATCLFTAVAWSSDSRATLSTSNMESFRAQLRAVEQQANEVSNLAKSKKRSVAEVRAEAEALRESVQALRNFVLENQRELGISDAKRMQYVDTATQTMEIIVENKMKLLADDAYDKNRGVVRAKAKSILARVKIIEKAIAQPRS